MVKIGSICSGISADSVAWAPLGWRHIWFTEIDPFACAVLRHHYPEVPSYGDFTRATLDRPDVLMASTPCQDFSVAGLRAGMGGERGSLTLRLLDVLGALRPAWLVFENVPGILSADGGRAFGAFLGRLGQLGYGFAYRILDAQFFGVPQRRRRVFVVGHLGDWRPAAAVLFERHSLSGNPPPRREAREDVAGSPGGGSGSRGWCPDTDRMTFVPESAMCLNAKGGAGRIDGESETFVPTVLRGHSDYGDGLPCLRSKGGDCAGGSEALIAHSLRADGFDASEDGTGRGTPLVPTTVGPLSANAGTDRKHGFGMGQQDWESGYAVPCLTSNGDAHSGFRDERGLVPIAINLRGRDGGAMPEPSDVASLRAASGGSSRSYVAQEAVAFQENLRHELRETDVAGALSSGGGKPGQGYPAARVGMAVRRLTPRECERLQGFPDDYTAIPYRGKVAADGPRYKALGNSIAVPVLRWIGKRIQMVEAAR